jgi:hypothetical protein
VICPARLPHPSTAPLEHGRQVAAEAVARHRDVDLVREPSFGLVLEQVAGFALNHAARLAQIGAAGKTTKL